MSSLADNPFVKKARKKALPDTPEGMLELLQVLSDEELEEMVKAQEELEARLAEFGPQDDDELHSWIKSELGINIPRTAVCEGHDPPFNFISDLYFERVGAVLAMGNRGGGKCVSGDSLIYDVDTGIRFPISRVVEENLLNEIVTIDNSLSKIKTTPISYRWNTGKNKVIRISLKSGRSIVCTHEHPLLTSDGWRRADELCKSGHIALPSHLPHPRNPVHLPDEDVDLLALLLSEGNYTQTTVNFSTSDANIVEMAKAIASKFEGIYVKHIANYDYRFTQGPLCKGIKNNIRAWLDYYGIGNERAEAKSIPEAIFRLPANQLKRFLSVFWMCDGYVTEKEAQIALASKQMVEDIQHLLLRFGVQSRVRKCANNAWSVTPYNSCLDKLSECLSLWGYKKVRLESLCARKRSGSVAGKLPLTKDLCDKVSERFARQTWHERRENSANVRQKLGWSSTKMPGGTAVLRHGSAKSLSREKLSALCHEGKIGSDGFELLLSEDLWWDEIIDISDAGVTTTYDLTINETHCFVANDIISHNTLLVAVLHWVNSLFKPGCEGLTFGATEAQGLRCYAYIKGWIYNKHGEKRPEVLSSLMRETIFANGSRLEIVPGTPQAVNGPHVPKAHADEIELMDDATWRESRNITIGKQLEDGRYLKPQDICTSTRKGPNGRMQKLIDEITQATNAGFKPPRKLYQWCLKEVSAQVPNCQVANPGLADADKCQCHLVRKGDWPDGSPRLLRDICGGDFYRSAGWQPFDDVIKQFTENDQETFEVQQLCLRPELKFHYLPKFDEEKHCFRNYDADPENGPIFTSVDWGGTNAHSVHWYQFLQFEIEVDCFVQPYDDKIIRMRILPSSIICFDEIYKAEIGNDKLGQLVKMKEAGYRAKWGDKWIVKERFADPQGKAARLDWKEIGLKTTWHITREFEEHIKVIGELFDDNAFFVAGDKCPIWIREAREWRRHPTTGHQIDTFNHAMSDFRYAAANIRKLHKRIARNEDSLPVGQPIDRQSRVTVSVRRNNDYTGPLGITGSGQDEFSRWRQSLGEPIRRTDI